MLNKIKASRGETSAGSTALRLGFDGFSMRCAGAWDYVISFPHKQGAGNFTFAVNQTSLNMDLLFSGAPGLPWLSFQGPGDDGGCKVDVRVTELAVTGAGILTSLIALFQSHIESAIRSKLNVVACQNGRAALSRLSKVLAPYQPYQPAPQYPANVRIPGDPSTLLDWEEVGLLKAIPNATRMGRIVNMVMIDTLGSSGIANASLDALQLPIQQLGTVELGVPRMSFYGLDTMRSLVLLRPATEPHSLRTALVQEVMEAEAAVRVKVTPATTGSVLHGPPLDLCFNASMNATDLSFGFELLAAMEESVMSLDHILDLGLPTLVSGIRKMNLTEIHLRWTMESLRFQSQDGSQAKLSHELVALIDALLDTMEASDSYRVLGNAFNGLVLNNTLRTAFNKAVYDFVAGEPPPSSLPEKHTIFLSTFFYVFFAMFMVLSFFTLAYCIGGVYGIGAKLPFLQVYRDRADTVNPRRGSRESDYDEGTRRNSCPLPPSPPGISQETERDAAELYESWGGALRGTGLRRGRLQALVAGDERWGDVAEDVDWEDVFLRYDPG